MSQPSIFHYFWPGKGVKPTYDFFDPIKRCKGGILKEILISYGESRDLLIVDGSTSIYDIFKYFGDLNKSFSSSFQRMASKGSLLWKLQESYMDIDFQFDTIFNISFCLLSFWGASKSLWISFIFDKVTLRWILLWLLEAGLKLKLSDIDLLLIILHFFNTNFQDS